MIRHPDRGTSNFVDIMIQKLEQEKNLVLKLIQENCQVHKW